MKHLQLYEEFKYGRDVKLLYRNTAFDWLQDFLKKGVATPAEKQKFISMSKDENSGDNDEFGNIRVEFDAAEIRRQGAEDVEYTVEYFKKHPDICMYVTGYANAKSYNKDVSMDDNTWEEHIQLFDNEEEVILKKITMKPGLIKRVVVWDAEERDDIPAIRALMKKHKIKVEVPWEK